MDLDMVSNCSSLSLQSEDLRSNMSTLSGLSTYQDEFAQLHDIIHPSGYFNTLNKYCTTKQDCGCGLQCEKTIDTDNCTLSAHLQNSWKIKDYNSHLYNLEKNVELKYYDKIEKLLKTNHGLQSELNNANEQIARLLQNYSKQNICSLFDNNFIQLEKKYHDVTVRYSNLQNEYFQSQNQKDDYEIQNKQLKTELNELKIDISAKKECIKEFKDKVTRQYVEMEISLKNNLNISQNLNEVTSELSHVQRKVDWYKERLCLCQNEKRLLSNEVLKNKTDLCSQQERIEILKVELSKSKAKYDLIELDTLKIKEKTCKQLVPVNLVDDVKNCQLNLNIEESKLDIKVGNPCPVSYYELIIQDLTYEITKVKEHIRDQESIIQKITVENSELISRCITLQKTIQQNEITIEQLEDVKKQLHIELNGMKNKVHQKANELMTRENQILALEVELKLKKDEQELIEQSVKTLREQFAVFKLRHRELKDESSLKNKQILQLENEKQKLFMDNNWNICELQKLSEKDISINLLKDELTKNNEIVKEYLNIIKSMEIEIKKNQKQNSVLFDEKETITNKHLSEIHKYEIAFTQYKMMVSNYDQQIIDLQKLLYKSNIKLTDLKDNIEILKQELNQRDINLNETNRKCIILENELKNFESKDLDGDTFNNRNAGNNIKEVDNQNNTNINFSEVNDEQLVKKYISVLPKLKSHLMSKVSALENKIQKLHESSAESHRTLNSILSIVNRDTEKEVQQLNVLLKVKELELAEKQKKYELNNRTLLRKVKEHMIGRNAAEKKNNYLQDTINSLNLEIKSKESEIENIKNLLEKFTNIGEEFKLSENLGVANKGKSCDKCELLGEKIKSLEKCIKELENEKLICQNVLLDKEDFIMKLQKEIEHLLQENASLSKRNKKFADENKKYLSDMEMLSISASALEEEGKQKTSCVDELNLILGQKNKQFSEIVTENNRLMNCLDETNTQVTYLSNEVKTLSSRLQLKSEEVNRLEDNNNKIKGNCLEKEKDSQNVINTLKRLIHDMQYQIISIQNEKFFLQRLCNDLKLAINSHINHNKVLKQQINGLSKEQDFNSLPNMLSNITCDIKYDDDYINELLQQNKTPFPDQPITEVKSCLDTLRREISSLQEQIARKNVQL